MIMSNISSKFTQPIITKFHIEPPEVEETKICSNCPGHMTNMATMPLYCKKLLKSYSPEHMDQWP